MKSYFLNLLLYFGFLFTPLAANEMFWEVNGTTGGKVYILASLERGKQDIYPLSQEINEAFDRSDYLILEIGRGVENEAFKYEEMYVKGRFEDNDSVSNHLSGKTYARLKKWVKEQKLHPKAMDSFQPWVIALTLSDMDTALWGDEKILSVEEYFYHKAQREGKGVYSLERIADAFMRLSDSDKDFQESLLELFMDTRAKSSEEVQGAFEKYKEGNISYFEEKLLAPFAKHPQIEKRLLQDRSKAFFNKIMQYMKNKRGRHYFLIVHLRYLLGDTGILSQLKEAGVDVKAY